VPTKIAIGPNIPVPSFMLELDSHSLRKEVTSRVGDVGEAIAVEITRRHSVRETSSRVPGPGVESMSVTDIRRG
jgi:hypothetical protein